MYNNFSLCSQSPCQASNAWRRKDLNSVESLSSWAQEHENSSLKWVWILSPKNKESWKEFSERGWSCCLNIYQVSRYWEKTMAPHSSTLAWKTPWTEEPGRLQSMGSLRVWHDWATSLLLVTCMHWRRRWQPTPMFLLGESQGRASLVGCRPWGHRVGHYWRDLAAAAAGEA